MSCARMTEEGGPATARSKGPEEPIRTKSHAQSGLDELKASAGPWVSPRDLSACSTEEGPSRSGSEGHSSSSDAGESSISPTRHEDPALDLRLRTTPKAASIDWTKADQTKLRRADRIAACDAAYERKPLTQHDAQAIKRQWRQRQLRKVSGAADVFGPRGSLALLVHGESADSAAKSRNTALRAEGVCSAFGAAELRRFNRGRGFSRKVASLGGKLKGMFVKGKGDGIERCASV